MYWLLAASALLALLIVVYSQLSKRTEDTAKAKAANDSHLGLKLEPAGSGWRLSWNPDAPVTSKATKGHLLISDGSFRKFLDLDSSDLQGGSIVYTPLTDDVVLRLEVDKVDSSTTVSESVRVAGGRLLPLAAQMPRRASSDDRTNSGLVESSDTPSSRSLGDIVGKSSTPKTKANGLPKPAQNSQANIQDGSEQVASNANRPAVPPVAELQGLEPPNLTLAPETNEASQLYSVSTQLPLAAPPAQGSALPATRLEPAQLIIKRDPLYPPSAKQIGLIGSVEVHFRIYTDGTVHEVSVIRGNPVLANAAVEAVQTWHYNPARLHGAPIETDGSAVVNFK